MKARDFVLVISQHSQYERSIHEWHVARSQIRVAMGGNGLWSSYNRMFLCFVRPVFATRCASNASTVPVNVSLDSLLFVLLEHRVGLHVLNGSIRAHVCDVLFVARQEFEGVEPCVICYGILHPRDMALPQLSCKTCKNR